MDLKRKEWTAYIDKLRLVNNKAGELMEEYIEKNGIEDRKALLRFAHALVSKYGQAASALACEMYDRVAEMDKAPVPAAEPVDPPAFADTAKAVNGCLKDSPGGNLVRPTVERLVKQSGADTTLKNAIRDGAYFAWVPNGDTCAFCITLASRGWQRISKKALKNGHAEHIHAHCDCQYAISLKGPGNIEGYDPDEYLRMYKEADGETPAEKIKSLRRSNDGTILESKESDIRNQSDSSLNKGIKSYKKRIEEHREYIDNPEIKIPDWDSRDERYKNGMIRHWEKEIKNFEINISRREDELRRRDNEQ